MSTFRTGSGEKRRRRTSAIVKGAPKGGTKVRLAEAAPRNRRPRKRHLIFLHLKRTVVEMGIRRNTVWE